MLSRRRGHLVLAGTFALVTACSATVVPVETATVEQQVGPAVEELTAEQLCALVPLDVVNEAVPVPFTEAEPGVGAIAECRYAPAPDPTSTRITLSADLLTGAPDEETLDHPFRDENDDVVDYQRIAGLGDAAGYGPYPRSPDTVQLVVLHEIENGYWDVAIQVEHPNAGGVTVEALHALAERVLDALPR